MNSAAAPAHRVTGNDRLPLYGLYAANGISMVGNVLTALAIPWFVLQTTGSAEKTGVTGFFAALPIALAAFIGGTIVDRLGFKRTSIVADLASGITVAAIPLLYLTVGLDFAVLLALVFMTNLLDAPGSTARSAIVPELATRAGVSFERAGALNQIIERSSRLVGAPIAGALIAAVGPTTVLWIDAATFAISAAVIGLLVNAVKHESLHDTPRHWRAEFLEGFHFIWRDRLLLTIVVTVMITNFLDTGILQTIYMERVYDNAVALGLAVAALGGGAVVGALVFGAIGTRLPRRWTFIGLFIVLSLRYYAYALYPPLPLLIAIMFLAGVAAGPINPLLDAVQYERVPAALRGRVFGAISAGVTLAMPLGALFTGIGVDRLGLTGTLILSSTIYFVTTFALVFNPSVREMERRVPINSNSAGI